MARIKKCPKCGTSNKPNAVSCKTDRIPLLNVSLTEEEIMSADESIEAVNTDTKTAQGEKFPCPNCDAMVNPGEPECIYCHTPLTSEQPPISLDESPGNSIANLKLDILRSHLLFRTNWIMYLVHMLSFGLRLVAPMSGI
jgi:hypothetical protein